MVSVDETAMEAAEADLTSRGIDVVRLGYSDMIGAERGRDLLVRRFARTVGDGVAFCRSVYGTSPMGDVVDIEGGISAGLPDVVAVPDVSTVQHVPWEPGVAHVIADVYNPGRLPQRGEPAQRASPCHRPLR
jgi:glutamine synthetase